MKIYLGGPMTGYKDFNFPAFHKAAAELRAMGHEVFSPAEKDIEQHGATKGFSLRAALQMDLNYICAEADGVVLLKGWETSKGARAESATAIALGLRRFIETSSTDTMQWVEVDRDGHIVPSRLPDCRQTAIA